MVQRIITEKPVEVPEFHKTRNTKDSYLDKCKERETQVRIQISATTLMRRAPAIKTNSELGGRVCLWKTKGVSQDNILVIWGSTDYSFRIAKRLCMKQTRQIFNTYRTNIIKRLEKSNIKGVRLCTF